MKIAIITDTHHGARNDSQIFSEYFRRFYDDVFFPTLEEHDIDTIIHAGDCFDRRKFINFVTLRDAKSMFFEPCHKKNYQLHMVVGNHCTAYKSTNDVNSQTLLLEDGYDNIHVYAGPEEIEIEGTKILMLPWINAENYAATMSAIEDSTAILAIGHLEVAGFRMYKSSLNNDGLDRDMFDKFDMVLSGHYHHKSSQGNIHYLGNPYGITWSDYNDDRGFHILDTEDMSLEFIRNPYEIFHKVWYDDEDKDLGTVLDVDFSNFTDTYVKVIITKKTNPFFFDRFIDELDKADTVNIQIVDDHFNAHEESEDDILENVDDTLTILTKYVDELTIDHGKKELDKLLRTLYNESLMVQDA
jgi:DNA repair exonuclease SbcCD nuclease subunit